MSLTGTRVLVVENDDVVRQMVEELFWRQGCVVRGASEGAQAVQLLKHENTEPHRAGPHASVVNGIEVLTTVRQHPRLAMVPVLVTTGTATTPFDLRDFRPLRVIRKPFDIEAVIPIAQKLLRSVKS